MMKFLTKILGPKETLFRELSLEDLEKTLQSQVIQHKWLLKMIDKLQAINMELDDLLDKSDKDRIWETLAIERRTILRCLTMILDVRDQIESERFTEDERTRFYQKYQGVSTPLNLQ